MKSDFITLYPLEIFFQPLHGKIHYFPNPWKLKVHLTTRLLLCAVIIITPKLPQFNVNNCCEWDIISFFWSFSSKNLVCAKNLQWMVLLPPLGLTLNAWFVTNGLWAKNCMHMQVVWSEHAMIEWSWVWSLLLPVAILWALFACADSPIAAVASVWIANWLFSPLLSARNPRVQYAIKLSLVVDDTNKGLPVKGRAP